MARDGPKMASGWPKSGPRIYPYRCLGILDYGVIFRVCKWTKSSELHRGPTVSNRIRAHPKRPPPHSAADASQEACLGIEAHETLHLWVVAGSLSPSTLSAA